MRYTGYWLHDEQLEKHWPEKQRLKRDFNKQITREDLDAILKRAQAKSESPVRDTKTEEPTSETK